jgi:hypothetical protein
MAQLTVLGEYQNASEKWAAEFLRDHLPDDYQACLLLLKSAITLSDKLYHLDTVADRLSSLTEKSISADMLRSLIRQHGAEHSFYVSGSLISKTGEPGFDSVSSIVRSAPEGAEGNALVMWVAAQVEASSDKILSAISNVRALAA